MVKKFTIYFNYIIFKRYDNIYISIYCATVLRLKTIVELLIRSHDCFTASCNMEGIASILRKCQSLANMLQILKYWALLVFINILFY